MSVKGIIYLNHGIASSKVKHVFTFIQVAFVELSDKTPSDLQNKSSLMQSITTSLLHNSNK